MKEQKLEYQYGLLDFDNFSNQNKHVYMGKIQQNIYAWICLTTTLNTNEMGWVQALLPD